jgi:hypothetical protein
VILCFRSCVVIALCVFCFPLAALFSVDCYCWSVIEFAEFLSA